MAKYKILYWHDIPSQVRATDENGRAGKQLSERFQETIDAAAMSLGLFESEEYIDGFQWGEELERPGSASEVAEAVAAELETKYQRIDWRGMVDKLAQRKK
jgi:hypothetical protein